MNGFVGSTLLLLLVIFGISVMVGAKGVPGKTMERIVGTVFRVIGSCVRWILNFAVLCVSSFVRISINRFLVWRRAKRIRQR